jgi:8-amino-3,8-dideoxy-alpha-D-manno-octulosonate transaminase
MEIARKNKLQVLEDCAQSNGARLNGRHIGTFGDIAIFSLQINKVITAGEGGMIMTNDDHLSKRVFAAHDLGYARDNKGHLLETSDDERYQIWGAGARMSELTGALALAQLGKIDTITAHMREAKWMIRNQLQGVTGLEFRRILDPEGECGSFLITILPDADVCKRFVDAVRAEGIRGEGESDICLTMEDWGLHWAFKIPSLVNKRSFSKSGWPWTLAENAFAKKYAYDRTTLPTANDLCSRSVLLMVPSKMSEQDISDIATAYKKVAKKLL